MNTKDIGFSEMTNFTFALQVLAWLLINIEDDVESFDCTTDKKPESRALQLRKVWKALKVTPRHQYSAREIFFVQIFLSKPQTKSNQEKISIPKACDSVISYENAENYFFFY